MAVSWLFPINQLPKARFTSCRRSVTNLWGIGTPDEFPLLFAPVASAAPPTHERLPLLPTDEAPRLTSLARTLQCDLLPSAVVSTVPMRAHRLTIH